MSEPFIILARFTNSTLAAAAQGVLADHGVHSELHDVNMVEADPLIIGPLGYIKLLVPQSALSVATEVLQKHPQILGVKTIEDEIEFSEHESECLGCNAPMTLDQTVCAACGWSFLTPEAPVEESDLSTSDEDVEISFADDAESSPA